MDISNYIRQMLYFTPFYFVMMVLKKHNEKSKMLSYNLYFYAEIDAASPNRTKLTFHHTSIT